MGGRRRRRAAPSACDCRVRRSARRRRGSEPEGVARLPRDPEEEEDEDAAGAGRHGGVRLSGLLLVAALCAVVSGSAACTAEQCAMEFMRSLDHDKVLIGTNLPYCTLLSAYGACLNRTGRACRGNLKFHSLSTMVMTQIRDHNCSAVIDSHRRGGGGQQRPTERCMFPYQHQKGAGGYRYCSMFGDPHLRTFEGQYETCRALGAWPLIDNAYLGVQVTNEPVAAGFSASGISKVTVIVKALPGCTDQKMFEATRDQLPSTFVDGTASSGGSSADSVSASSLQSLRVGGTAPKDSGGDSPPHVVVRTLEEEQRVEIHLRYVSTRVVIRRAGGYLTVAIKLPDEVIVQRSSLNTLQLCLTGCPSSEQINYKEVLAYPEFFLRRWGVERPAVSREHALELCRLAGVTDFFFDSCVFDLLTTGDESFKDSARAAMEDIRHLYPPYKKHYETRRADLNLYDELRRLGRQLELDQPSESVRRPLLDPRRSEQRRDDGVLRADPRRAPTGRATSRSAPSAVLLLSTLVLLLSQTLPRPA